MCGVSERDREASTVRRPWPTRGCCAMGGWGEGISEQPNGKRYNEEIPSN